MSHPRFIMVIDAYYTWNSLNIFMKRTTFSFTELFFDFTLIGKFLSIFFDRYTFICSCNSTLLDHAAGNSDNILFIFCCFLNFL